MHPNYPSFDTPYTLFLKLFLQEIRQLFAKELLDNLCNCFFFYKKFAYKFYTHVKLNLNIFFSTDFQSQNHGFVSPRRTSLDLKRNVNWARDWEGKLTHFSGLALMKCGVTTILWTTLWTPEYNRPRMPRTSCRVILPE